MIVLVLAAVGVAAWSISHSGHSSAAAPPARPRVVVGVGRGGVRPAQAGQREQLQPARQPAGQNEDPAEAGNVIDGNPSTFWHTSYYVGNPVFGKPEEGHGTAPGHGPAGAAEPGRVQFGTTCCAHVQIEIGNDDNPVASALSTFTVLQSSDTAQGDTTFNVSSDATGRYVLIWLTYLPPLAGSANRVPRRRSTTSWSAVPPRASRADAAMPDDAGDEPSDQELLRRHVAGDSRCVRRALPPAP